LTGLFDLLAGIPGALSKTFFKHELTPKTMSIR
jgi:hypothetical protein